MKSEFILENTSAELTNANPRKEMHGEETEDAIDLDFLIVTNDPADLFRFLEEFKRAESYAALFADDPGIGSINLAHEYEEHGVTIKWKKTGVTFPKAKVRKFKYTPAKGTTLAFLTFQVQSIVDYNEIGKLCHAAQTTVQLTTMPPEQQSLDLGGGDEATVGEGKKAV